MTAKYFMEELDEAEHAEKVWDAILLGDRQDTEHNILLYQIEGFYVEVFYNQKLNVIRKFSAFESTVLLAPYLDKINFKLL